jgi:hypothetical protein
VEVVEFLAAVFLPGPTERGSVVEVVDVEVDVVVSPLAVLGGVCGDNVAGGEVVGTVLGTLPDGDPGVVVLVVDELLVTTGWTEVAGRVVVVCGTELLVDAVAVDVVGPVVGVVIVVDVVVVAEDVGTVVVVVDVVVVTPVPVVVVAAVVVVTADDGGSTGVVKEVGSASAVSLGVTNAPRARPVAKSAPPDVATSRASHLLEL